MKNKSLNEKFKNNILVKPLYQKVARKVRPKNLLDSIKIDKSYELDGDGFKVKKKIVNDNREFAEINKYKSEKLPGRCENVHNYDIKVIDYVVLNNSKVIGKMLDNAESEIVKDRFIDNGKVDKVIQAVILQSLPDAWLRVFPLPMTPKETVCSVIFRCIVCQIGLASILLLWTTIWVFVIHSFEGPYELQISVDFEREQNQLVIDLATELRQITPISPKWREAIERRINEERVLTILAVGRGARINPGQFWDLAGTFLFCVYVMTALGFGAPVPHTVLGRSSALIYAFIAVPTHIYLMVNMSTCLIINLRTRCCRCRKTQQITIEHEERTSNKTDNPSCERNSELMKTSNKRNLTENIIRIISLPCACRCVPLAAILYFACGAVGFGVLRDKGSLEVFMFPLEFTTTGGLEHVEAIIRILYGFYVEGAMVLLACALATLRSHSSASANYIAEKYRLFQVKDS